MRHKVWREIVSVVFNVVVLFFFVQNFVRFNFYCCYPMTYEAVSWHGELSLCRAAGMVAACTERAGT